MAAWDLRAVADVAELVDAPDLGSGAARRGGSSPFIRTSWPARSRQSSTGFYYRFRPAVILIRKRVVLFAPPIVPPIAPHPACRGGAQCCLGPAPSVTRAGVTGRAETPVCKRLQTFRAFRYGADKRGNSEWPTASPGSSAPFSRSPRSSTGSRSCSAGTFKSSVDIPERFRRSRGVGAHIGLTPRRYQSGELDRSGRISKHGDADVRNALVEAAGVLLNTVKRPSALKAWGHRIAKRRGMAKATVAVARRMSMILHRMWLDGTEFRWSNQPK